MEFEKHHNESRLTPEKALVMLHDAGLEVTVEQASEILDFLRKLANIAVSKYLEL